MRNVLGYAMTVVAALCWGASGVSADYLMTSHGIELTLVSFFRMLTAGILTLGFALARARRVTPQHRELVTARRNWLPLVSYAIFGLAACQLSYMGVIRASLVGSLEPIAATGLSALVMGTRYTIIDLVGILLIVGAVVSICVVDLIRARRAGQ